ncbi:hypothetical protein [Agrobacterium pusense]|uniref:hypothetical protein n=1 Tax=Agrobacterium pusense TaxID=648995 RepID=UPI0005133E92|nr:hypothetical protein [Agrobacterium pusense]ANV24810.1 hypothetical protein BA939_13250 [Rhizobium sp. S41]KGE82677.1 hypothetical protein LW14_09245 [Rhizobium sp. H41]QWW74498.1 hypothetical protein KP800_03120 [Agrobacterium pusense]
MGRMTVIAGAPPVALANAPKIIMTGFEKEVANMPGLLHFVDPAWLASDASGRDRMSGAIVTPRGVNTKNASDSNFNGQATIKATTAASGVYLPQGAVTPSYTAIVVSRLDPDRYDAAQQAYMFAITGPNNEFRANLRSLSSHGRTFDPGNGATTNTIANTSAPGRGVVGMWGVSFDFETKQSALLYNNGADYNLVNHSAAYTPVAGDRWNIGCLLGAGNSGWVGDMAIAVIFDRAMHLPTNRPYLDRLTSLFRSKYGLS